jgi:hypothetical protein
MKRLDKLADNGCMGVIEGGSSTVTAGARKIPGEARNDVMTRHHSAEDSYCPFGLDGRDRRKTRRERARIYQDVKNTASEFNAR